MPKKKDDKTYISKVTVLSQYGFTEKLIKEFLPEPKCVRNPHYSTSAPMQLWDEEEVKRVMETPEFQAAFQSVQSRRNKRIKNSQKTQNTLSAYDLDKLIEKGRRLKRKFVFHVGETNSGKTYNAIQAIKNCGGDAVYLGPLRLLALEMFDTLNQDGYPCSLLTGEEYQETSGARITASTIELCDYGMHYDVAVIDEAQLIGDPYRGAQWTKAICAVNASEVHVCMAPEALDLIIALVIAMNAPFEVQKTERLVPLVYAGYMKNLFRVQPGDAVITFSRKSVLAIAATLEQQGIKASVIYGALPPASRREEVRKFASHETSVVVATDAIGMGISLPIRRVIFAENMKFDGVSRRELNVSEVKQIAGRAGRYKMYDIGKVMVLGKQIKGIEKQMQAKTPAITRITLPFPEEALNGPETLPALFAAWHKLQDTALIRHEDITEREALYEILGKEEKKAPKPLLYSLLSCPVDTKDGNLVEYWRQCCSRILKKEPVQMPEQFPERDLEECERKYKAWDIYHQMQRRVGIEDPHMEEKATLCKRINELLRSKGRYRRTCSSCGEPLPPLHPFGMCEECYQEMRRRRRSWYGFDDFNEEYD